ncbi:multidrug resistance protein homolog 65-like [Sitodiplosis mosellana]|uniref:multidrug resistance protein homolog 65-like n=1 Tax=Sitodiplosis mosellana TaxID=263140 RepID=UPI0024439757|nr:multidrug resistance protein homolog 65-like [Sitodiplosis mosellana]XP_055326894.1 multidrug resistance protein homolog 65-like [Sitodiplosis mosellana]
MELKVSNNKSKCFLEEDDSKTLSFLTLYRFASRYDLILLSTGIFFTLIKACSWPFLIVIYGEFTSLLVDRTYGIGRSTPTLFLKWFGGGKILTDATTEANNAELINDSIAFFILSAIETVVQLIVGIICVDCFNQAAINQVTQIRIKYFASLMRQDIGWYDIEKGKSNFTVRLADDIEKIKTGIAEQVSHFLNLISSFVICVIMSFIYGWKLTLIVISYIPILCIMNIVIVKVQAMSSTKELNAYAKAANIVEEVLGGIRTVFAFGGEKLEVERYKKHLLPAENAAKKKGLFACVGDAVTRFLYFASCALSFWFGVQWVIEDRDKEDKSYTTAVLITVFLSLLTGAENLARISPYIESFAAARGAAKNIFAVIDRPSKIDSMKNDGKLLDLTKVKGNIEFKNLFFNYPSRSDVQILNGLNLKIEAGQTVALVGNSGNGKSTCLHLLQRFYDPDGGAVLIDDCDIREFNINSLRSSIAIVSQEPVLFSMTIGENIRYGNPSATDQQVIAAAQMSGAHDFISRLPQGYNTMVGEFGSQFSGGQRQRIAIARALIQNPKILLLDEATSALDYHSEKFVQQTLDRASEGRTTIVVSHRMSAIKNADRIVFIDKGQVIEDGTHSELIELRGRYYEMVKSTHDDLEESNGSEKDKENDERKISEVKQHAGYHEFSSEEFEILESQERDSVQYWKSFKRILGLLKPDWIILTVAIVSAIVLGFSLPLFSIVFSEIYATLSIPNREEALEKVLQLCLIFLGIGVLMFAMAISQTLLLAKAGARLTRRVRLMTFGAMMRQECGWFDEEDHSVGILASYLSGDAASVQTAVGFPLCVILQSVSTVVLGIIIAISTSIKLTAICFSAFVLMVVIVLMEARNLSKSEMVEKDAIAVGMKVATEAISNIRTVASLRQEKSTISRFTSEMENVQKISRKKVIWRGLLNSITQAIPGLAYGFALAYGGYRVAERELHYKYVIRVCEAMLYGVIVMSQTLVFAPTIITAFTGAHRLFKIIDRKPLIDSPNISNKCRKADKCNDIKFQRIDFRYPTRPDVQILNGFNLNIIEGKTVALVGPSGCGKSTCIQLLQRLYDPEQGRVHIGLDEISSDITLKDLRSKLSIVSQEPTLFDRTIAENIAYGDCSRKVTMDEIIDAAKIANAHNFIVQLPQGYDTNVGSRATQLSGGQKQRIAIARALIRNPKILLLDEATSALDLHSEKTVQIALDSARSGRTCITIAHRLSTIQNADIICVVQSGRIVESGSHTELLALNGIYTRLYNAQK